MRRFLGFFIGAAIGGAMGAAVALLLAPSSGQELRETLSLRVRSFGDQVRQASNERRIELEDQLQELRKPQV